MQSHVNLGPLPAFALVVHKLCGLLSRARRPKERERVKEKERVKAECFRRNYLYRVDTLEVSALLPRKQSGAREYTYLTNDVFH